MAGRTSACGHLLVVDGDDAARAYARAALVRGGFEVAEAATADEALSLVDSVRPALAVVEVNLPAVSGYELCHRLAAARLPEIPVILVSADRTEPYDRVAGLLLGADDYLAKPFAAGELLARVRCVLRRGSRVAGRPTTLTKRELEVLTLLSHGQAQPQIAEALFISPKTVSTHIERILEKLEVRSRAQAIAVAYRDGLVSSG